MLKERALTNIAKFTLNLCQRLKNDSHASTRGRWWLLIYYFSCWRGITSAGNLQALKGGRERETSDRIVIRVSDVSANWRGTNHKVHLMTAITPQSINVLRAERKDLLERAREEKERMIFHPHQPHEEKKKIVGLCAAELTPNCSQFIKTRPAKRIICPRLYQLALSNFSSRCKFN